jgi:hypothetical protein
MISYNSWCANSFIYLFQNRVTRKELDVWVDQDEFGSELSVGWLDQDFLDELAAILIQHFEAFYWTQFFLQVAGVLLARDLDLYWLVIKGLFVQLY